MPEPDKKELSKLLERWESRLLALGRETLVTPRVSRGRVVELSQIVEKNLRKLVPLFEEELSVKRAQQRLQQLNELNDQALVFYAADIQTEDPWTPEKKKRRKELSLKVRKHDRFLFGWAWPLFRDDPATLPILIDIRSGRGTRDDADDTIRLVKLMRDNWSVAEGKTLVTADKLKEAEQDATELIQLLDLQDSVATGSPRDLCHRAYTLWYKTYEDLRILGRYLAHDDPEANQLFPGVRPFYQESKPSTPVTEG